MKTITLYEDNRLDNKKDVPYEQVHQEFTTFEYFKTNYPILSYKDCLRWFLASNDGLHSSFDEKDFEAFYEYSWDRYKQ